jgi:hypothetical protein
MAKGNTRKIIIVFPEQAEKLRRNSIATAFRPWIKDKNDFGL